MKFQSSLRAPIASGRKAAFLKRSSHFTYKLKRHMLWSKCYLRPPACTHSCETLQQLDGSEWEVACSVCVCVCVHICWQLCLNGANLYGCVSRELQGFWHLFLIITIKRMTSDAVTTVQLTKRSWFKKLVPSKPWMVSLDGNLPRQVSGKDSEWWRRKCTEDKRI